MGTHITPKYVQVYNQLIDRIEKNEFKTKLPSENELCKIFNVSRVTLRSALALLKEDGAIIGVQGRGNYINKNKKESHKDIQSFSSPFYACCNSMIASVDTNIYSNDSSNYSKKLFENDQPFYSIDLWYKDSADNVIGTLFSITPASVINSRGLDLNDAEQVRKWIEKDIYLDYYRSNLVIKESDRKPTSFKRKFFGSSDKLMLIREDISSVDGKVLIQSKYYLPLKNFQINFNRYVNETLNSMTSIAPDY